MTSEKDREEALNVDSASWDFMSVTEIDAPFIEKRERMKVLIGRRDNRIRSEAVKAERLKYRRGCVVCEDGIFDEVAHGVGFCFSCGGVAILPDDQEANRG